MQTRLPISQSLMREIPDTLSGDTWGRRSGVGTLFVGANGIAFLKGARGENGMGIDRNLVPADGRCRPGAPVFRQQLLIEDDAIQGLVWPQVMGRLDLSEGDWHCPRFALRGIRRGGWGAGLARLSLGRQAGRYRGYILRGDCNRYLLIPAEAGELFERWLGDVS